MATIVIMNRLKTLIIAFFPSIMMFSQVTGYTLAQHELKGKVSSATERTGECVVKFGEYQFVNSQENSYKTKMFDKSGKLIQMNDYAVGGDLERVIKYSYKNGQQAWVIYNADGSENNSGTLKFRPQNTSNVEYAFHNNGFLKTISYLDEYGNILEKNTYNLKGCLIERKKYKDSILEDMFSYKYNSKGNLVSMTRTRVGGYVSGQVTYEYLKYDSNGNWTMRVKFSQKGENGEKMIESLTTRMIEYY